MFGSKAIVLSGMRFCRIWGNYKRKPIITKYHISRNVKFVDYVDADHMNLKPSSNSYDEVVLGIS